IYDDDGTADPLSLSLLGMAEGLRQRCVIRSSTGDATKIDENVPTMIPNVITSANGLITSPAKNDNTSAVASVVPPVSIVRGSVSLIERFNSSASGFR